MLSLKYKTRNNTTCKADISFEWLVITATTIPCFTIFNRNNIFRSQTNSQPLEQLLLVCKTCRVGIVEYVVR